MLVRKNYYLYAENDEKQQEKRKLLGSVRLAQNGEQWVMEIQWKNESEAEALVSKAEEGELQLRIREKEVILGQERQKSEFSQKKEQENDERNNQAQQPVKEVEEHNVEVYGSQDKVESREETHGEEEEISDNTGEYGEIELSEESEADVNADKIEEWELVCRSCHKVEVCRELGEVYRVNKGDFAVLLESIKHILQNSFLVHGLMNYGYLLLFRTDEKLKQLGVGVPGVYYEKEKLVAEMFGFPQFWCDGKSNNGKFGYYLRIVS